MERIETVVKDLWPAADVGIVFVPCCVRVDVRAQGR